MKVIIVFMAKDKISFSMHQCSYCCWYYNGYCHCPIVMKKSACNTAQTIKEKEENSTNFNYQYDDKKSNTSKYHK